MIRLSPISPNVRNVELYFPQSVEPVPAGSCVAAEKNDTMLGLNIIAQMSVKNDRPIF